MGLEEIIESIRFDEMDAEMEAYLISTLIEHEKLKEELEAAKVDLAALLWLNGDCQYCKWSKKVTFSGAERWRCTLGGDATCCSPEWRGVNAESSD